MRSSTAFSEGSSCLAALLRVLCIAGLLLGVASAAQGRTETLRWSHQAPPEASGFRVYIGSSRGNYIQSINVGLPARSPDGIYSFALEVGDEETVWVAVSAYNPAGESGLSNDQMRSPDTSTSTEPLGQPGRPQVVSPP